MSRPQDKHLIPLTERSEEEAHAIRSAGGKASQQKRREKQMMADLVELYSGSQGRQHLCNPDVHGDYG